MPCSDCKHWKDPDDWYADKMHFRQCGRIAPRWKIEDKVPESIRDNRYDSESAEQAYDRAEMEVFAREAAYVIDGSQYVAELHTAGTFSCSLHEPTK